MKNRKRKMRKSGGRWYGRLKYRVLEFGRVIALLHPPKKDCMFLWWRLRVRTDLYINIYIIVKTWCPTGIHLRTFVNLLLLVWLGHCIPWRVFRSIGYHWWVEQSYTHNKIIYVNHRFIDWNVINTVKKLVKF